MYWPLVVMDPGPELVSPPETAQVTLAAPPPESMAENCSTAVPDAFVALQPVQLVSIEVVEGERENVPFDDVPVEATVPPPQPATTKTVGKIAAAKMRAVQCRRRLEILPPAGDTRQRRWAVIDAISLNSFSAFPNSPSAPTAFDAFRAVPRSPAYETLASDRAPPPRC